MAQDSMKALQPTFDAIAFYRDCVPANDHTLLNSVHNIASLLQLILSRYKEDFRIMERENIAVANVHASELVLQDSAEYERQTSQRVVS